MWISASFWLCAPNLIDGPQDVNEPQLVELWVEATEQPIYLQLLVLQGFCASFYRGVPFKLCVALRIANLGAADEKSSCVCAGNMGWWVAERTRFHGLACGMLERRQPSRMPPVVHLGLADFDHAAKMARLVAR